LRDRLRHQVDERCRQQHADGEAQQMRQVALQQFFARAQHECSAHRGRLHANHRDHGLNCCQIH
jgi:hypothetical protein